MNFDTILKKFELFAEIPGVVARLRELVLQLAVRGKLVAQDARELPAIECIRRANQPLLAVKLDGTVATPPGWVALPLGCLIASNTGGGTPSKGEPAYWNGPIPWASVKDVQSQKYLSSTIDSITEEGLRNSSSNLIPANRLILVTRMGLGKLAINSIPMAINQDLRAIEPTSALDLDYAYILLKSIKLVGTGVTVKGITIGKLHGTRVLVPPLAEQKRIAAKVDELLTLCDELDEKLKERETRHAALARASVARFAEAPTAENLELLFHQPVRIEPGVLRGTIYDLAVAGKLTEQDPGDVPADALLKTLDAERRTYAQEHQFRAPLPEAIEQTPFALPNGWTWARLASLFNVVTDGDHLPPPKSDDGVAFLTIGNITTGKLDFEDCRYVPRSYYESLATIRRPVAGDILYTVVGATYGRPALVDTQREFCVQRHIAILKPAPSMNVGYLLLLLRSPLVYKQATGGLTGIAQPTLPLGTLRNLVVPLPSIGEQQRIVAKVEQLMTLVHELEAQLNLSRTTATQLLDALSAELTGTPAPSAQLESTGQPTAMKTKADTSKGRRAAVKPLHLSTKRFELRRFAMSTGYRSLGAFDCTFHAEKVAADEPSPICLVGLNGSGKSNLIEAVAEVFCFLELINLAWTKLESASSVYRENGHRFELEYLLEDESGEHLIRVRKQKKSGADFFIVKEDGTEQPVPQGLEQLRLLPRRIVGYSSGLNETVSHPFLRTRTIYSEEVREAAPPEGEEPAGSDEVFDTRTLYMDYESNAAIILCNYIFPRPELRIFEEYTRVRAVPSFGLRFNRKRAGKSGIHSVVRLTSELKSYLKSFARCAGQQYDGSKLAYNLKFVLTPQTIALFHEEFQSAEKLFMAMHKWSLLNALILSDAQRTVYLKREFAKGALERPPSVPPSDRVFNIVDLMLELSVPKMQIPYSGLSDGEHQFMQVFGTALLFSEPGTLFLFDEPESHFNPQWRTKFNLLLNDLPNASRQEYIISTHSPFIVSGSRMGNVYKFTRKDDVIQFAQVDSETYGAAFDVLLRQLFSMNSLIDQSARQDLEQIIQRGDMQEMQDAVGNFAESKEKRRLYEEIIRKEET